MTHIFGIGLSRTGTTSLTAALRSLGYRATHNRLSALRRGPQGELAISASRIARFEAVTGIAIAHFYRELDRMFPDAKFILTTRDAEGWYASLYRNRRTHALVNLIPRAAAVFEATYGTLSFSDRDRLVEGFEAHRRAVLAYFAARPGDLLVLDIQRDAMWEAVCGFLDRPVEHREFPWLNRRYRTSLRNLLDFVLP